MVVGAVLALSVAGCGDGADLAGEAGLSRLIAPARELAVSEAPAPALAAEELPLIDVPALEEPAQAPPTTVPPETTSTPPTPTNAAAPAPVIARALPGQPAAAAGAAAYAGLGTWIDAYDWSLTFGKDGPLVEPSDIDRMADLGVQTLYVQTSRWNAPDDVLEPERLVPLLDRARARGLRVVAWYLPTFVDPATDLRRLVAAARLGVDSVAVDIESRDVADHAERNQRLVELSEALHEALPGVALGAVVFPPVVMEVVNPSFWPGFPWRELAPFYDVWVPMAYQSFRTEASGLRDGYRYTAENIDRIRANLGDPAAPVHSVGGIADATTRSDVIGMVTASSERGALGGSLYDWRTTAPELWPELRGFRR